MFILKLLDDVMVMVMNATSILVWLVVKFLKGTHRHILSTDFFSIKVYAIQWQKTTWIAYYLQVPQDRLGYIFRKVIQKISLKEDTEVDDVTKLGKALQSDITLGTNDE